MLNIIWVSFFLIGALSAVAQIFWGIGPNIINEMITGTFSSAKTAFEISLGLTGLMTLWLGLMKVAESAGLINVLTRWVSPVLHGLFPEIPKNHPAFGAMMMNLSANMLGLDNAATPLGLKAMKELQTLNPTPDTATNAQVMFLVINTASVTLIPMAVFNYLYELGYQNPTELFVPILLTGIIGTLVGVSVTCLFQKINLLNWRNLIFLLGLSLLTSLGVLGLHTLSQEQLYSFSLFSGNAFILFTMVAILTFGLFKKLNVFEEFISGAKEGFQVAITIIPYLVAMLVGISFLKTSGALDFLLRGIAFLCGGDFAFIKALPVGLMKPFTGSGARALMIETVKTHGVDSIISKMAAIMQGSSETTFYVLALYFGSVGIKKGRHALLCGLIADITAVVVAILVAYMFFG